MRRNNIVKDTRGKEMEEEKEIAINMMFKCDGEMEQLACYQYYLEQLKDWTFVSFVKDFGTKLPDELCKFFGDNFAVINLGCEDNLYAVNKSIYEEMLRTGKAYFKIDTCIELDTQAVSYLKNVFREYDEKPDCEGIKDLVDYLQKNNVNYSCMPYLLENAGKKDSIDPIECYKNIKSYVLLKAFNCEKMKQNEECVYDKTEEEILIETDILYNDFLSDRFVQGQSDLYEIQKIIYVLLMKAICIEFANSKRSAKNKMMDLVDFVNEKLGILLERELQICYCYFKHDDRTAKFFRKVQKNSKELRETINGMAWDLTHIRSIEKDCMTILEDDITFAVHVLLTYDNGIKDILQINPVDKIALCKDTVIPKLKNDWFNDMEDVLEKLIENKEKRARVYETRKLSKLCRETEEELEKFCVYH